MGNYIILFYVDIISAILCFAYIYLYVLCIGYLPEKEGFLIRIAVLRRLMPKMDKEKLFKERLLEHYHHPRNVGTTQAPDFSSVEYNHSCGDQIQIEGHIKNDVLTSLSFIGSGCMLSQAVASMVTESCTGYTVKEVLRLDKEFVQGLIGISLGPTRLRCALMPLYALQHGIIAYIKENEQD